ncbi:NRT2 ribosyltransferase, partial [Rhipidura dahli]|nr:NRT2 ribosyltransferase [Rhipidura dahli]
WPLPSMAPLAHTLALLAMTVVAMATKKLPLDMAKNSFDDQYWDCGPAMAAALPALKYSEFQQNPLFARGWAKATAEWQCRGSRVYPLPSPDHAIALMAYTMDDLYREFNSAVRVAGRSRQEYRDNFHWKTLHFLLTDALAVLNPAHQCYEVYRGVEGIHFTAERGHTVRFGQFTSASRLQAVANEFGNDTKFQVYTCHGVAIWGYSAKVSQQEVLIPPFETFKVTDVTQKGNTAEIRLHSNGIHSNYNCEWLRGDIMGTT